MTTYSNGKHSFSGATNSRAQRTASKFGFRPVSIERLTELLLNPKREETAVRLDPWIGCRPSFTESANPDVPPVGWTALPEDVRRHIAGEAIALLSEHGRLQPGDRLGLAHKLWERVRDDCENALGHAPIPRLTSVLTKLAGLGDVEATLRRRRDELDAELAKLARMRGAASAAAKASR